MRFMMLMYPQIEEADWNPTAEAVAAMGRYNEELQKAGMLLALDGLRPPSDGGSVSFDGEGKVDGHRRALRRGQGGRRRLLADPGALEGGGAGVGAAAAPTGTAGSRCAGSSRWRTSRRRCRTPTRVPEGAAVTEATGAIEAVWRIESARLIAGLARMVGDVGLAEDMAQDALVAAMEKWPRDRRPRQPGRLADGDGEEPGDRPDAAGEDV